MTPTPRIVAAALLLAILLGAAPAWAQTAKVRYEGAFERETAVRTLLDRSGEPTAAERSDVLRQVARVVTSYEGVVRRYPDQRLRRQRAVAGRRARRSRLPPLRPRRRSRHGAAPVSVADQRVPDQFADPARQDPGHRTAERAVGGSERSGDQFVDVGARRRRQAAPDKPAAQRSAIPPPAAAAEVAPTTVSVPVPSIGPASDGSSTAIGSASRATLSDIQRAVLPGTVRVTLELDREVAYHEERITGPDRVFFDLKGAQLAAPLTDKVLSYSGRHRPADSHRPAPERHGAGGPRPERRVPLQRVHALQPVPPGDRLRAGDAPFRSGRPPSRRRPASRWSRRAMPRSATASIAAPSSALPAGDRDARPRSAVRRRPARSRWRPRPCRSRRRRPRVPMSNGAGGFSLSRQLGLGVSRIVIDPGHGGHDPGRAGQRRQGGGPDARRRAAAREAAGEGSRHRGGADAAVPTSSSPRGAHRASPTARAPTCSCRFTPTPAATPRRTGSRPTS